VSGYLTRHGGTRATPQSEAMREDQILNSAGGFVWEVDDWTKLRRFLILGTEGGSYYASERDLTISNVKIVQALAKSDGLKLVEEIVEISDSGRAPKNDPALYALACAISLGDKETKRAAAEALPKVARIGTHLYHFVAYAETMRGWGRTMRWAVSNWYAKNPEQLALQAVKYRQRDGWSHRDLLRLAHPKNKENAPIFDWITHGNAGETPDLIKAFEMAQVSTSPAATAAIVRQYNLPREALQPEHLNEKDVWAAMLENGMPMHAMMRNLATMTRNGVLGSREYMKIVTDQLGNAETIRKSRLHPLAILIALRTYAAGRGFRGQNTWNPIPEITDALDEAFYFAFDNVPKTGKRYLIGLDVSGSMSGGWVAGAPISPREAATALALVTLHAEDDVVIMAFANQFMPVNFSRRQRLDDACALTERMPFMGTDCSLPMLYATKNRLDVDAFMVLTDSETWAGYMHPKQALDQYRQQSGIPSKSVVVGMVANKFSIADPNDAGMMDVVGFDTAAPGLISSFVSGTF
jgi:60 kDa SS-A/Ro ribonucleoprotein